jgi:hypothetical protein
LTSSSRSIAASPASTRARTASAAVSCALGPAVAPTRPRDRRVRRERSRPGRDAGATGRIVGRVGAALWLGDCRATGRGHLAHKGLTDALHVCSGWRHVLATR